MKTDNPSLVIACPVMKNNKNISMIARSASCFGASKIIITGQNRIDPQISRDIDIVVENHRSIVPVISKYKLDGYRIVGLEQHPNAVKLHKFSVDTKVPILLVVGNECRGIDQDIINCLDAIVEIEGTGKPKSLNVAVAASMFMFVYSVAREIDQDQKSKKPFDLFDGEDIEDVDNPDFW